MFKNIISILLSIASAVFMLKFALPKLMAADISVKSFTQFAQVLPIDGITFMYFTGVLELTVAIVFIVSLFTKTPNRRAKVTLLGVLLLIGTLVGALLTEFFVRPEPISFLVQLSCVFITTSFVQFMLIRNELSFKN